MMLFSSLSPQAIQQRNKRCYYCCLVLSIHDTRVLFFNSVFNTSSKQQRNPLKEPEDTCSIHLFFSSSQMNLIEVLAPNASESY